MKWIETAILGGTFLYLFLRYRKYRSRQSFTLAELKHSNNLIAIAGLVFQLEPDFDYNHLTCVQLQSITTWLINLQQTSPCVGRLCDLFQSDDWHGFQTLYLSAASKSSKVLTKCPLGFTRRAAKKPVVDEDKTTTDIHQAIEENDLPQVASFLRKDRALLNLTNPRNQLTPIQTAIEQGNKDIVEYLLAQGADCNVQASLYDHDNLQELALRFNHRDIHQVLEMRQSS